MMQNKINILFVCHGNICRSPMAEFIMKDIVKGKTYYNIESRATTYEEIGNDIYYLAKSTLDKHNIVYEKREAKIISQSDYDKSDLVIVMDEENIQSLKYLLNDTSKVHKLLDYSNINRDVYDPWYTRRFEDCYNDLKRGCLDLYNYIEANLKNS